jgi:hypothetical protein
MYWNSPQGKVDHKKDVKKVPGKKVSGKKE